jgi:hypothetical protein
MNCHKFLAVLAVFFLFQNTFPGNDNSSSIAPFNISATPAVPPAPPAVPVIGNGSLLYSVSIVKNLLNGTPLTQEEKRFPKIALGVAAINVLSSCAFLKMMDQPISVGNVALLNVINLPITWFFSEFLNGEWDD